MMQPRRLGLVVVVALVTAASLTAADPRWQVPPGFVVERVAGPPLVNYPMFACFDDRGRLFVAEGTGTNLPGPELVPLKLGKITLLEDKDGDGKFDTSTVFADKLIFPTGVLWHDGALYAASHPNLWRFRDTNGDGKADQRDVLVSHFNFNGNGCDVHGPFLGPDGRLYWTDGRHGYKIKTRDGTLLEGFAARIFRSRTDGTEIERLAGGGFDNPVELAFTPEGDAIGTMDQGPGDALLHYVEGGVYPMDHPCVKEFPMTGPMLGAVRQFSASLPVALCGLCRYRSAALGAEFHNSLFTTQFNVHRIQQHQLVRDGSTYRSLDKDFVTSSDYDVHLTDVLEDADGSLLFVDMGAWFNYGCPTSKIAKPEVKGAIYRVRRHAAAKIDDPRGWSLKLADRSAAELTKFLDDPRPVVRDQAVEQLGKRGSDAVEPLAAILRQVPSTEARRNAIWAMCRIQGPQARAAIRLALADKERSVRQAAVHAAGLDKDQDAADVLMKLVVQDEPAIRLKAAEALGRIAKPQAISALLESIRQGNVDRFSEHAITYALLRIDDPKATLAALSDPNPRVRQAGIIALDQMKDGKLTREQVIPLLDTDDLDLQQAVLGVVGKHPEWSKETLGLLREWLAAPKRTPDQERSLTGALMAFSEQEAIQKLAADFLTAEKTPPATRLLLLQVLGRCRLETLPASWTEALRQALEGPDLAVCREAIATVKARNRTGFDKTLLDLSRKASLPPELRIAALDCLGPRLGQVSADAFDLLSAHVTEKTEPLLRVAAARTLGAAGLNKQQIVQVARLLPEAGPMIVPLLLPAFRLSQETAVGLAFVRGLQSSPGAEAVSADDLDKLLKRYPEEVTQSARALYEKLAARHKEQAAYLATLTLELLQSQGNVERGKEVFFSKKTACYGCHRAAGKGGNVGPDLSLVGRFRTTRDLLESVVFPSSSVVPEFRAYVVTTKDGRQTTGMIVRDSTEAIHLRTQQLAEVHIARKDIEDITPSNVSIMPEGLEKTLTRQELTDLLEFLYHQK